MNEKYFSTWCNLFGFLRHNNEKKNILYFRTCKIDRYESSPTYAFGHIFRRSSASVGGAACAGTAAV
jgi:hypothetical protein